LIAMGARVHSHAFMPLLGTPLRGATPVPLDAAAMRELERMESAGAMYGQWRKHQEISAGLVALRAPRT